MSPFLLLIALSVGVPRCLSKTSDQYSICAPFPFSCGDFSINLSYPFSIDGTHTGCSHPGFHLSCTMDNLTQLMIYNTSYSVKYVDYVNQIMTLADTAYMNKDHCPLPTSNTSLDFSLFDYTGTDRNVSYYYCSSQAVGVSSLYQLSCDASTGMYDYYFTVGDRVAESCTGLVYFVPIYASFMDSLNVTDAGKALMSLKEALREGFDAFKEGNQKRILTKIGRLN
ncbi:hypothetical protein QJS10_CPB12g00401 [Acorus calamus]|uniref:Wall-associated receptor kinase galacturonan-binding domain-containing protein n=1 Tax=Acorus calamus TaxID=4465 RepID=A0AAV9DP06_ACOCL|nr:hypothetical protein QJS10_CPB12g00401 [Acorus calamus]